MDTERLLAVDDDQAFLQLMIVHLQRRGYTVHAAQDGFSALQMLRQEGPFAVLITDLTMPGLGGLELLREARRLDPTMEVVVVTADIALERAISAMREDGAYDYLPKPLEMIGELSLVVRRALEHRRLKLESERLKADLAAEADRLRTLIAHIGEAVIAADPQDQLQVVNGAAVRLLGTDSLTGQSAAALPPALANLVANWRALGHQQPAAVELPWPEGSVHMAHLMPLRGAGNAPAGWLLVLRDVTHFKQLDDLKMRLLTEAAGRILMPLAQALTLLAELSALLELKGGRPAEIVRKLVNLWHRIQNWMDELLTLVRVEAGGLLKPEPLDVGAVLSEVVGELRAALQMDRGITVKVELPPTLPAVQADPELLRQLLRGLLVRAAGRSSAGAGVRLTARAERGQVWVDVQDAGPAIDAIDMPHIFEKTFASQGVGGEGTGLELAMAKTVLERLGGQVWVHGTPDAGSAITLCLPAVPDGVEAV